MDLDLSGADKRSVNGNTMVGAVSNDIWYGKFKLALKYVEYEQGYYLNVRAFNVDAATKLAASTTALALSLAFSLVTVKQERKIFRRFTQYFVDQPAPRRIYVWNVKPTNNQPRFALSLH